MNEQIFNTEFEISIRILSLLFNSSKKLSLEKISYLDFISTYSKDFSVNQFNIHGESNFKLSEFITRRLIISNSIKQLVLDRYIIPSINQKKLVYKISKKGSSLISSMNDDYFFHLMDINKKVLEKYSGIPEKQIYKEISMIAGDRR